MLKANQIDIGMSRKGICVTIVSPLQFDKSWRGIIACLPSTV